MHKKNVCYFHFEACLLSGFFSADSTSDSHFIINPDIFDGLFLHGEMVFSCYTGISHLAHKGGSAVFLEC